MIPCECLEPWYDMYLKYRDSIVLNHNPFILAADDPNTTDQVGAYWEISFFQKLTPMAKSSLCINKDRKVFCEIYPRLTIETSK